MKWIYNYKSCEIVELVAEDFCWTVHERIKERIFHLGKKEHGVWECSVDGFEPPFPASVVFWNVLNKSVFIYHSYNSHLNSHCIMHLQNVLNFSKSLLLSLLFELHINFVGMNEYICQSIEILGNLQRSHCTLMARIGSEFTINFFGWIRIL